MTDLIPDDNVVITLSKRGYIKRTALDVYQQQRRGGKGIAGVQTGDEDMIQSFCTTSNHQYLLLFTNRGRMHQLRVYEVPEGSRTAKGMHIANLFPLEKEEFVTTAVTVREFAADRYFLFVTKKGMVKRSSAEQYSRVRKAGLIAVGLKEEDELLMVREVNLKNQVILVTKLGLSIRFPLGDVRSMGRSAAGVKGVNLRRDDEVASAVVVNGDQGAALLTIASNGYGKRTPVNLYRQQSRGGKGIINMKVTSKTGHVIGAIMVSDTDELVLLTSGNKIIRLGVSDISQVGRATQGVRLVKVDDDAYVVGFDIVHEQARTKSSCHAQGLWPYF